jgi:hypothetical protein
MNPPLDSDPIQHSPHPQYYFLILYTGIIFPRIPKFPKSNQIFKPFWRKVL